MGRAFFSVGAGGRGWREEAPRPRERRPAVAGGPQGERNGNYRHGRHTKETKAVVGSLRRLIREAKELSRMLSPRDPDR